MKPNFVFAKVFICIIRYIIKLELLSENRDMKFLQHDTLYLDLSYGHVIEKEK
jgi:hypothetical protein